MYLVKNKNPQHCRRFLLSLDVTNTQRIMSKLHNPTEIWIPIKGFTDYQISNTGRVKSLQKQDGFYLRPTCIKYPSLTNMGYYRVHLRKNKKSYFYSIHRLVALHFLPNPENKLCVNHKNSIKTDNRVENIEWSTYSENTQHAIKSGTIKTAENDYRSRAIHQLTKQGEFIKTWYSFNSIKRALGFRCTNVCACCNGRKKSAFGFIWSYDLPKQKAA